MIAIYLGDDPYGYQRRHLLICFRIGKLVDEGFD